MNVISHGATDTGLVRTNNEDAFLIDSNLGLYAVADGIGGNAGGEVASSLALETLASAMASLFGTGRESIAGTASGPEMFPAVITEANDAIRRRQAQDPGLARMGTTLTALFIWDKRAVIANVGDSRAYLLREGVLRQLTVDHSVVAEQLAAGLITPERARTSPYRNVITRAVGIDEQVVADITQEVIQRNDRFLLCTDGLTAMLTDEEIERILPLPSPQQAVQGLIAAANSAGGRDNVTAVVIGVEEVSSLRGGPNDIT